MVYDKLLRMDQLQHLGDVFRKHKITCVTTNGIFDLFGSHHLQFLCAAKKLGDLLIVGLNTDNSTMRIKGPDRPIISQDERAEILCGLECVNHVCLFDTDTPEEFVGLLGPNVHVKSSEYGPGGRPCPEAAIVEANGGRMVYLPLVHGESTTAKIRRIKGIEPLELTHAS